jgi:hypothetical protein
MLEYMNTILAGLEITARNCLWSAEKQGFNLKTGKVTTANHHDREIVNIISSPVT